VLFVSQKAQALKVVKDKLNELKVNGKKLQCLYGYIPNLASPQIGEADELDGIAPQLAGLGSYLAKMEYGYQTASNVNEEIRSIVGDKKKLCNFFNTSVDEQRLFCRYFNELQTLQDYAVSISSLQRFKTSFTSETKKTIDTLVLRKMKIEEAINYYEKSGISNTLKEKFRLIDLKNSKFSEVIEKIKDDYKLSGYDGHSQFLRKLNNFSRRVRLGKVFNILPREFKDYITSRLSEDISRAKAVAVLEELLNFCRYYESKGLLEQVQANLNKNLNDCGLSLEEFLNINSLIVHAPFDEIKQKIIRKVALDEILNGFKCEDHNISHQLFNTEKSRRERVIIYIQNLINKKIKEQWGNRKVRSIINTLSRAFRKSKKAYKTFDALKREPDNFKTILSLVPVWIMELEDASRLIPLEPAMFDYVIFDESSQCNLAYAMPSMFRAKSAIFFGDSEQMRDDTVRFKSNRAFDELARRYSIPQELNIKPRQEAVQSVLDMAFLRGFLSTVLQYHYRSPKELIGFSNKYFYIPKGKGLISLNTNYLTYGNTNKIMLIHPVSVDWDKEISDKINVSEAEKILEIVRNLKTDSRYNDKSIGILTFFNLQAAYIRKILEEAGYTEENDIKVSIIDGIQGDEKDIVIYSFVLTSPDQKKRYISLAGEGGEINKEIAAGRVNVAFSRARMQVHCVISMPVEKFPGGIWIDKFLKYVDKHGIVNSPVNPQPFDSYFEEEFYYLACFHLQDTPYTIQNQIKSCGFKIDFVISNPKNGEKVAIECDGPTHFKDEIDEEYGIYVDSDIERQCILDDAGYRGCFYRIKYSDWIKKDFDRTKVMREILSKLA
jgi:superfamily I DNA and/or RNA helicase